MAIFY